MDKPDFDTIKALLLQSIENGYETELTLHLKNREYMIIIYDDHCSFLRCGHQDGSREYSFPSLDALYNAEQIDGIILARDWNEIEWFDCMDFDIQGLW